MRQSDGTEAFARARSMRRFATAAEAKLWGRLRGRRLENFKFRRQHWIGSFIVDFVCLEAKLVIEADGGQHAETAGYDEERSRFLEGLGFEVLRFWNNDIEENIEGVLEALRVVLIKRLSSPSRSAEPNGPLPLPEGRGVLR